jgi:hypothetical protein
MRVPVMRANRFSRIRSIFPVFSSTNDALAATSSARSPGYPTIIVSRTLSSAAAASFRNRRVVSSSVPLRMSSSTR